MCMGDKNVRPSDLLKTVFGGGEAQGPDGGASGSCGATVSAIAATMGKSGCLGPPSTFSPGTCRPPLGRRPQHLPSNHPGLPAYQRGWAGMRAILVNHIFNCWNARASERKPTILLTITHPPNKIFPS